MTDQQNRCNKVLAWYEPDRALNLPVPGYPLTTDEDVAGCVSRKNHESRSLETSLPVRSTQTGGAGARAGAVRAPAFSAGSERAPTARALALTDSTQDGPTPSRRWQARRGHLGEGSGGRSL